MNFLRCRFSILIQIVAIAVLGAASLFAQSSLSVSLAVDATQAPQKTLHTHMTMPVKPGPLTLYYPKWIPGEHMPSGPLGGIAGLRFLAGGSPLAWRRDLLDPFTFHLDVPQGVDHLQIDFDFIESSSGLLQRGEIPRPTSC